MRQIVTMLAVLAALVWALVRASGAGPQPAQGEATDQPAAAPTASISMLYSPEKREWLQAVHTKFERDYPHIQVMLREADSVAAIEALAEGRERPSVWCPASSLQSKALADRWMRRYQHSPYVDDGGVTPSLLRTRLVVLAWKRGAELLGTPDETHFWSHLIEVTTPPKAKPSVGAPSNGKADAAAPPVAKTVAAASPNAKADAGAGPEVKLGFADPRNASSGLEALYLILSEFLGYPEHVEAKELDRPDVRRLLAAWAQLPGEHPASTTTVTDDMLEGGPDVYDFVITYENLALIAIEKTPPERWGGLTVYYPPVTLWVDHPAVVIADDTSPAQRAAAQQWIGYLLSPKAQASAVHHGFWSTESPLGKFNSSADGGPPHNPFLLLLAKGDIRTEDLDVHRQAPIVGDGMTEALLAVYRAAVSTLPQRP